MLDYLLVEMDNKMKYRVRQGKLAVSKLLLIQKQSGFPSVPYIIIISSSSKQ
jgi:hypothetical protein